MAKKQLPLFPSEPASSEEISKFTPLTVTFDHFRHYLTKEGKSQHTIKAFIGDMQLLVDFTEDKTPIGDFTTSKLNDYLDWMENKRGVPCSRKSYARRVTTLKVYFKWLKSLKAISHDPSLAVLQRSGPAPLSHVLTVQQIRDVIDIAQQQKKGDEIDYRPELLFQLLLETGIKKSEAGRLTFDDFERSNPKNATVIIRHKSKNVYKERRIDVTQQLMALLEDYREQYRPKDTIFTCTTRNLEYILTALGEGAGVPFKLSFEVMRWTMGVVLWRDGIEEDSIRERMGLSQTSWYETSNKIRRLALQQADDEKPQV
ncbi:MAG: tyrosine-type recombinase/integrase [Anaerolineae bacterium]|nr:tyrosine-type recombinase/integrase [Anaerolineae bacterium]MDQ7034555.1 tyrosine-type recombinase/integrase [Anaerolineae bacterium]